MSVQHVDQDHVDPRVADVPCTIRDVGAALSDPQRLEFYTEVIGASAGEEIDQVLRRGRAQALLERAGCRERRPAGRRVSLEELAAPLGGLDAL